MKNMTRSKNQALYKFLPEMWVSEGMSSGIALTSRVYKWNYRKMDGIYKSFIEGEIKRQLKLFGGRGGDISSYNLADEDIFEIVEPNGESGIADIIGTVSPLFFYCSSCGKARMLKSFNDIPVKNGPWHCPSCSVGTMKQLQMIYTCECGFAAPIRIPHLEGIPESSLRYRPTSGSPFKMTYEKGNTEKFAEFKMTCKNCGNQLIPDNVISGRNYKPFPVKMINLVDEKDGLFFEKGVKAHKVITARWFGKISFDEYTQIKTDVSYSFDERNGSTEVRRRAEEQAKMLVSAGIIPNSMFELTLNKLIEQAMTGNRCTVDQCVNECDKVFLAKKNHNEEQYNRWLEGYSFKLMQYYTIKDSIQKITLSDSIKRQSEMELIDSPDEIYSLNKKLGISSMLVSSDAQIITCIYGYTRKTEDPKNSRNTKCRLKMNCYEGKNGKKLVYAAKLNTEGILFEIDMKKIVSWLYENKLIAETSIPDVEDNDSLKRWYAENVKSEAISSFSDVEGDQITAAVFGLLHSISHAFMKSAGEMSGLASNSLSEIIFLETASIFIYAQTSQGIPLGALSGMAECRYAQFLKNTFNNSRACIFDPICKDDQSACSGCLIISDTSCNHFNKMLGRKYLYSIENAEEIKKGFWEIN